MHVGDSLDGVVETVAALSAVAKDLVVLHPADHMLYPGTHLAVGGVVVFLARQQGPVGAFAVRYDHPAVEVGAVAQNGHVLAVFAQPGGPPGVRVRGGARHRAGGGNHKAGVGIDDDLHVRREPLRREGADPVRKGRAWGLPLENRVLLVAAYWRTNLTLRQLAPLFGISKPAADRIIDHLGQPRKLFRKAYITAHNKSPVRQAAQQVPDWLPQGNRLLDHPRQAKVVLRGRCG